jgi:hypothetical protein
MWQRLFDLPLLVSGMLGRRIELGLRPDPHRLVHEPSMKG